MKELLPRLKKTKRSGDVGMPTLISENWLTGQFLVAMPGMADPRFVRTVVYVCSHGPGGAMGLIVNRLFGEADFPMLLDQLNIKTTPSLPEIPVQFGGPVEIGRGFVLHTNDYLKEGTTRIDDTVAITATVEIIEDIANGQGPTRAVLLLGYAGWGQGQLEAEVKDNGWLTVGVDEEILFDTSLDSKWERAMAKIGIKPAMLSNTQGQA